MNCSVSTCLAILSPLNDHCKQFQTESHYDGNAEINHHRKGPVEPPGTGNLHFPKNKGTVPQWVEWAARRGKRRETVLSEKISHREARLALQTERVHQITCSLYVGVWRLCLYCIGQVPFPQNSSAGNPSPQSSAFY